MKKPKLKVKRLTTPMGRSVVEFDRTQVHLIPHSTCQKALRMIGNIIYKDEGLSAETQIGLIRGILRLSFGAALEQKEAQDKSRNR